MQTILRFTMSVALAVVTCELPADQGFDATARSKAIAPFLDAQTIGIVHVDLARIEVDPLFDKFLQLVPEAADEAEARRAELKRVHAKVMEAGVGEFYVVISLADLPRNGPFFIVPNASNVDAQALAASLPRPGITDTVETFQGALFLGHRQTLERLKAGQPDPRAELAFAFEAAGDTVAQVLLLPPRHSRRVIEELMPSLPPEVGGGPSTILTRGLLWAAVGIDSPPRTSINVVIQSEDAEAAAAFRAKWLELARFLATREEARRMLRDLERAVTLMTPKADGDRLVLALSEPEGTVQAFLAAITPPFETARAAARRSQSTNNLKQLALAMHNYHDTRKSFPAVGNVDASGKLLLSWRVHILPYLDQMELYKQFHLDEPWDSEHNRTLVPLMPAVYRCPESKHRQKQGLSTYRVVSGEGTVFPGREGLPMKEIKDGTSNTIMIVEVDDEHAVVWTKPQGLPFDSENPARGLGGQFKEGFDAAFCDGSVRFISDKIDPKILRLLLTRGDGQPIPEF